VCSPQEKGNRVELERSKRKKDTAVFWPGNKRDFAVKKGKNRGSSGKKEGKKHVLERQAEKKKGGPSAGSIKENTRREGGIELESGGEGRLNQKKGNHHQRSGKRAQFLHKKEKGPVLEEGALRGRWETTTLTCVFWEQSSS